ncbi:PaaI family thioesterase [Nannocystis bainbridge]|uniref:PaaI family thioesterase n=1 Tax=Nannocystis bainbridge TaxID=2995303 RepID=A0ABT5E0N7_9BACT|nr:PaaI family thioesterase [Nannocystis bainbridge]MDC0718261.1 PaaI family thioesterase [Nannocystis bainbridge]
MSPTDAWLQQVVAEARAAGDPGRLAAVIPYAQTMGISLRLAPDGPHAGELQGVMRFGEQLIGNPMLPALHGGALCALLESTAIFQLLWESAPPATPRTISLTVEYLRSGRPVDTFARGVPTRQGRRVTNVRVEAWQDDRARPIAVASAHLLVHSDEGPVKFEL